MFVVAVQCLMSVACFTALTHAAVAVYRYIGFDNNLFEGFRFTKYRTVEDFFLVDCEKKGFSFSLTRLQK